MKKIFSYITILILLTGANVLLSQRIGFIADWQAVIRKYNGLDGMEVGSTYYLYGSHSATKHTEVTLALVARKSKNIYQKIDHLEYIVTERFMVMIDHEEKLILFDNAVKEFSPYTPDIPMDYLQEYIKNETVQKNTATERQYEISFSEGEVEKLAVTIDKTANLLKDMTIFYAEKEDVDDENKTILVKMKLKILFSPPKSIQKGIFTIESNPFIALSGNKVALKPKYKNYELIDNRIR